MLMLIYGILGVAYRFTYSRDINQLAEHISWVPSPGTWGKYSAYANLY